MINLRHHRSTFGWILVCCIWLCFDFIPIIQANQSLCSQACSLKIQDERKTYHEFKRLTMSHSIKTIFFQIKIGNESFSTGDLFHNVYFAWIKNDLGKAVLTLPSSYIVMSLSLYTIFIGTLDITLIDLPHGCLKKSPYNCIIDTMFKVLTHFTQLKFNDTCNAKHCPTICRRRFTISDDSFGSRIEASCCQKDLLDSQINITTCRSNKEHALLYIPILELLLIIVSMILTANTLNSIANWLIDSVQR